MPTLFDAFEDRPRSIQERFESFHAANPAVFAKLVELARDAKSRGAVRIGISLLWERMRWYWQFETAATEEFKLCNAYRSRYARLMIETYPEFDGFFELRELRAA